MRDISVSFGKIKEVISHAQEKHKIVADKHRSSLAFKENYWVLLRFTKARLRHRTDKTLNKQGEQTGHQKYYMKLAKRYYGPFQILQRINETSYRLKLPSSWHIHNAFHVSLLKPYKGETPNELVQEVSPNEPVQEERPNFDKHEEILWPEEILRHEDNMLRSGKVIRRYLIRFRNYPPEDAQWMHEPQLKDYLVMLQDYKFLHNV